ncbi:hypothetical protein Pcinc_039670 [Petrolisthes cinctipes]|uniref:Uncharacterized protein n=1 Tax=Petrolisthes cinctipes TaxID=88211 RepID=A0AAE1BNQ8_PETCI|nr:hypothetical protein Pcinc_039670 [Petrolisthes cinctipes]
MIRKGKDEEEEDDKEGKDEEEEDDMEGKDEEEEDDKEGKDEEEEDDMEGKDEEENLLESLSSLSTYLREMLYLTYLHPLQSIYCRLAGSHSHSLLVTRFIYFHQLEDRLTKRNTLVFIRIKLKQLLSTGTYSPQMKPTVTK